MKTARAVVACMKNEGQFVVEWLAYHRVIGFDPVAVVTNDCEDGTDLILDRLAAQGAVLHLRNPMTPGLSPQLSGLAHLQAHPVIGNVEWLLHIDADEFLHVSAGTGQVDDLLSAVGPADAIAIAWKPFGNSHIRDWPGGSVLGRLTMRSGRLRTWIASHKTMFRPEKFGWFDIHMPKRPLTEIVVKNSAGTVIDDLSMRRTKKQRYRIANDDVTWENADIHHYAIKADDLFLLKNLRGSGMALDTAKNRIGSTFWRRQNRNEREDTDIHRCLPRVEALAASWRAADPDIAALEGAAFDWFDILRRRELTGERRAMWTAETGSA